MNYRSFSHYAAGLSAFALSAATALAASMTFKDLVYSITSYIGSRMPIVIAIGVLIFFGNRIFFVVKMDSPTERQTFRKYTVNTLIGLTVLLAVWGIIGLVTHTLHWGLVIPQLPTQ